jgi:hypothetical protein
MASLARKSFKITYNSIPNIELTISRSISTHCWKGYAPYKEGSKERQEIIDRAFEGAKDTGFDGVGAHQGVIAWACCYSSVYSSVSWLASQALHLSTTVLQVDWATNGLPCSIKLSMDASYITERRMGLRGTGFISLETPRRTLLTTRCL